MTSIPTDFDLPSIEREIQSYWTSISAFETQLSLSSSSPVFTFFDGPPFATGLPHFGNILAGTVKDVITRFKVQSGYSVPRVFGWDCHGLPIENEIQKKLSISPSDIGSKISIADFNRECRSIVQRFAGQWKSLVSKTGRWIDFDGSWKTMDLGFMEGVWGVFKRLHDKGLIYKGAKVLPYSVGLCTPLSNFEASSSYKVVSGVAITVRFTLNITVRQLLQRIGYSSSDYKAIEGWEDREVEVSAWTTTPWTLPSNRALVVHPTLLYSLRQNRITLHGQTDGNIIKFKGEALENISYKPLFNSSNSPDSSDSFNSEDKEDKEDKEGGRFILTDTYVTEDGTGVVHCAPGFGEDDFRVYSRYNPGFLSATPLATLCPMTPDGLLLPVPALFAENTAIEEANKIITAHLQSAGRIIKKETISHSYPFCERSKKPLIYRAVPSWFLSVTKIKADLVRNNLKSRWVPRAIQTKRFGNWLENARDWAISRTRYWGTPLPVFANVDGVDENDVIVVGSVEEIYGYENNLNGRRLEDIHYHEIADLVLYRDGKAYKRIMDVFDCWFESGSMPYSSRNGSKTRGEKADFIAEGIDQTRGWFYTLLVLSTALNNDTAFSNLIVHGLVLARDGKKMSKHLRNFSDPLEVIDKHGADSLRVYLLSSPVVKGEGLKFKEEELRALNKKLLHPVFNALRFFLILNSYQLERDGGGVMGEMDGFINNKFSVLNNKVIALMEEYNIYPVFNLLSDFVEVLNNFYIKVNRKRMGDSGGEMLGSILIRLSLLMSSFVPFFSEWVYQKINQFTDFKYIKKLKLKSINTASSNDEDLKKSVHFVILEKSALEVNEKESCSGLDKIQEIIELGRRARDKAKIGIKQPLSEFIIYSSVEISIPGRLLSIINEELNINTIEIKNQRNNLKMSFIPIYKSLGVDFGKESKRIILFLDSLKNEKKENLDKFYKNGILTFGEFELKENEHFEVNLSIDAGDGFVQVSEKTICGVLNVEIDEGLRARGDCRKIKSFIQKMKKENNIVKNDVLVRVGGVDEKVFEVVKGEIGGKFEVLEVLGEDRGEVIDEREIEIGGGKVVVVLSK